jgi:hypothetical protein
MNNGGKGVLRLALQKSRPFEPHGAAGTQNDRLFAPQAPISAHW